MEAGQSALDCPRQQKGAVVGLVGMLWLLALGYIWVETVGEHGADHHHDGVAAGAHEPDRTVENFT